MIIDTFWVNLLENFLLKVSCLIMILLERIFFYFIQKCYGIQELVYLIFNFVKGYIHNYQTQLRILRKLKKVVRK